MVAPSRPQVAASDPGDASIAGSQVTGDFLEAPVFIIRFAKYGRVEGGPGPGYDLLIQMAECEGLGGTLRVPMGELGQPVYPGFMRMSGKMIITMRVDNVPAPDSES